MEPRDSDHLTEEERRLLRELLRQVTILNEMIEAYKMRRAMITGLRMAVIALGTIVAGLAALDTLLQKIRAWLGVH